jgi:hypothetical protein
LCVLKTKLHRKEMRKQATEACCVKDEGWPLGTGIQVQVPNRHWLLWPKATVLSADGKGRVIGQVGVMKLNENEELIKRRKYKNAVKTMLYFQAWDKFGESLIIGQTTAGVQATGA